MLIPLNIIDNFLSKKVSGVIHVGGHIGEEIPEYLLRGWNVAIFEPQQDCYDKIVEHPSVKKYNVALGAKSEIVKFNISSNKESSSILSPKLHLVEHPHITFDQLIAVRQETLDSYNLNGYNFMNLDVQGYELEVLKGSIETLKNIDYIYTEINEKLLYENCVLLDELDNWLRQYSFNRTHTAMTKYGWGDALYAKI